MQSPTYVSTKCINTPKTVEMDPELDDVFKEDKQIAMTSGKTTDGDTKVFRQAFDILDVDGDGTISKEELKRMMRALGQFARKQELEDILKEVDRDGDGKVSFEEFVDITRIAGSQINKEQVMSREDEDELRTAFRVIDKNNRGFITKMDLKKFMRCLGEDLSEEDLEAMIKEADIDGDGRIDFYEFVNALDDSSSDSSDEEH